MNSRLSTSTFPNYQSAELIIIEPFNMALRDSSTGGETATTEGSSAVSGLPPFWDSADTAPKTEWEEWWDLFMVAANAKDSISVNEMLRTVTQQHPRIAALINNLNEQAAERKTVSVLFLSLGSAARKSLTDKYPEMRVATISLQDLKVNCEQAFVKPRKRTYKFFARKRAPKETLRQFWHTITGMAAKCAFGEQTESLIMDTFIQNMNNKMVQLKLCTEHHCTNPSVLVVTVKTASLKHSRLFWGKLEHFYHCLFS